MLNILSFCSYITLTDELPTSKALKVEEMIDGLLRENACDLYNNYHHVYSTTEKRNSAHT